MIKEAKAYLASFVYLKKTRISCKKICNTAAAKTVKAIKSAVQKSFIFSIISIYGSFSLTSYVRSMVEYPIAFNLLSSARNSEYSLEYASHPILLKNRFKGVILYVMQNRV